MIWVTSDLHFNHLNILKYEPESRPFENVEEMNKILIENWNKVVKHSDTVYVLGDLMMGSLEEGRKCIEQLNGKIVLVRGNHDTSKRLEMYKELGIDVHDIFYLPYKGRYFIMCHFPIASQEFIDMVIHDNSEVVNLYGHVHHNAPKGYCNGTYHVGVDTNNLIPISIEQIWNECWPDEQMKKPEVKAYHDTHQAYWDDVKGCYSNYNMEL